MKPLQGREFALKIGFVDKEKLKQQTPIYLIVEYNHKMIQREHLTIS